MKVFVQGKPGPRCSETTLEELNALLWRHIPERLIHENVVADVYKLLVAGAQVSERRVSRGKAPEHGSDGKIVLLVKAFAKKPEEMPETNDFRQLNELHLFDNVQSGREIARIYPEKKGEDGHDAFGKIVPAKAGKPYKVQSDSKSIEVRADEGHQSLYARIDGYLENQGGALRIVDTLVVNGDVDYHMGNIDFVGSVMVQGDVHQGFMVRAVRGVTIRGAVNGGAIYCTNGDIECRGAIFGGAQGVIHGAGALKARILHKARIDIRGDLTLDKESIDSEIATEGALIGPRAHVRGGHLKTATGAEVKVLGVASGKETLVTLCSDIETRREFSDLIKQIRAHEHALEMLRLHLGPLASRPERVELLVGAHREKMERLIDKWRSIETSLLKLKAKRITVLSSAEPLTNLAIAFHDKIHTGVKVRSGEHEYIEIEGTSGPKNLVFQVEEERFSFDEFAPIQTDAKNE
jgi:uncharacterized protein (DUF342 family)